MTDPNDEAARARAFLERDDNRDYALAIIELSDAALAFFNCVNQRARSGEKSPDQRDSLTRLARAAVSFGIADARCGFSAAFASAKTAITAMNAPSAFGDPGVVHIDEQSPLERARARQILGDA